MAQPVFSLAQGECPANAPEQQFRLRVIAGPDRGLEIGPGGRDTLIGTADDCSLVLRDLAVSPRHCLIRLTTKGFLLRDLGSGDGTRMCGHRVESAYLSPGATIAVGESTIRFDLELGGTNESNQAERWRRVLGRSSSMERLFAMLPRIAAADSTVLLEGETGTGKGLLAQSLHEASPRAQAPFITLDCAAISPTLVESELFGHEKGAFTGAHARRVGAFQAAEGGTLFLDEIGELPLELQPKFLRALEERQIKRIGSVESIRVDVRVIAATNRELRIEVERGRFRSDLFYRLNVVRVRIPPLRERAEDVPLLVSHFYAQFTGDPLAVAPPELVAALVRQNWSGNVRELRSAVERAVLMNDPELWRDLAMAPCDAEQGGNSDLDLSFRAAKERAVTRWERAYIQMLLRETGGNISRAARVARMDRNHLRDLLRRYGIAARDAG